MPFLLYDLVIYFVDSFSDEKKRQNAKIDEFLNNSILQEKTLEKEIAGLIKREGELNSTIDEADMKIIEEQIKHDYLELVLKNL